MRVERSVAPYIDRTGAAACNRLAMEISACIETYDNEIAQSIGSLEAALIDVGDIVDDRAPSEWRAEAR